jgi:hypothetical protein
MFQAWLVKIAKIAAASALSRMREGDFDLACDAPGVRGKNQDAVTHKDRFLDVVRDQQHRFYGQPALDPEIEKVSADCLSGQYVECRKRFIQQ